MVTTIGSSFDFEKTTKTLLKGFDSRPKTSASFYNWKGEKAIETAIRRLVSNADRSIIIDIWSEDVRWIKEPLLEAERRGLSVTLITIGECTIGLNNIIEHKRSEEWQNVQSRKFSILCDSQSALIGNFGESLSHSALETNHVSVIELLQNAFYHDVIMERIEQDFSEELTAKYGNDYENIVRNYKDTLE